MSKSAGRAVSRSKTRVATTEPGKVKTSVTISHEAFMRLGAACLSLGVDQGELVESMIHQNLSCYVVQVRGEGFDIGKARPGRASQENLAGPAGRTGAVNTTDRPDPAAELSSPAVEAA